MKTEIQFRKGVAVTYIIVSIISLIICLAVIIESIILGFNIFSLQHIDMFFYIVLLLFFSILAFLMVNKQKKNSFLYYTENRITGRFVKLSLRSWKTKIISVDYNLKDITIEIKNNNLQIIHNNVTYSFPIKKIKQHYQKLLELQKKLSLEN